MKVLFVAGFGPIVSDMQASQAFYQQVLGLPLEGDELYLTTEHLDGVKHFALWPLSVPPNRVLGQRAGQMICLCLKPGLSLMSMMWRPQQQS